MFSSEKFLSPIVSAGLPTPGPLAAGAGVAVVALALLELLEDDLLPPHAASPTTSANTAELLVIKVLNLRHGVPLIGRLLLVDFVASKIIGPALPGPPRPVAGSCG